MSFSNLNQFQKPILGAQLNLSHPLVRGLQGFWLMNEANGGGVMDVTPNRNHGIITGATWRGGEKSGSALNFDGASGERVDMGDVLNFAGSTTLTIIAKIYLHSFGENNQGRIIDKDGGTGSNNWGWALGVDGGGNDRLNLRINATTGLWNMESNNGVLSTDVWVVAAVAWDAPISAEFYIDGETAGADTSQQTGSINSNTHPLRIGTRASDENREFDGIIEYVLVWDRTLTPEEIRSHYKDPYGMFDPITDPAVFMDTAAVAETITVDKWHPEIQRPYPYKNIVIPY